MKGFTLGRNPINVNNVVKPLVTTLFNYVKELILERNPMNARTVGEHSPNTKP